MIYLVKIVNLRYLSFNEPGLLVLLPEESNFHENIKEDEPFPEFLTIKK